MSHIFSFSRYQTKCVIKSIFRGILIYLESSFKPMVDRKKLSEGKLEIQKIECLENEKSFLDEIKSIFHNYLKTHFQV